MPIFCKCHQRLQIEISNSNSESSFFLSKFEIKVKLLRLHFVDSETLHLVGNATLRFSNKFNTVEKNCFCLNNLNVSVGGAQS